MNKKFASVRYIRITVVILLLAFTTIYISPVSATDTTEDGIRRADMMAISERYVNYTWTAINSTWGASQETNEKHSSRVDTPDVNFCAPQLGSVWGCWDKAPAVNVGVPYFWGGSTAIEDDPTDGIPDLYLKPHDLYYPPGGLPPVGYFGEKIAAGAPAGDIGTFDDPAWSYANGVDCIGFVGQVWRTGTRLNMPKALSMMRPIRFQDLRAGDVIQRYISGSSQNHVVVFRNWINYNPGTDGAPFIGAQFMVYEAALKPNKVVVSTYELTGINVANPTTKYFRGQGYLTDKVEIKRIEYCDPNGCNTDNLYEDPDYYPYTYLNPIDVVLVIDRSGSMSGDKLKQAKNSAKMFVDLMRPGDKIGVVVFNNTASVVYPLQEILPLGVENYVDIKGNAKTAIDSINATGGTSIGAGLQAGQQQLNTNGSGDPVRLMLLLSDGVEFSPPFISEALPSIIADKITVYSVGLGNDVDHIALGNIANQTGGTYHFFFANGMTDIFNLIYAKVYGENVVKRVSGIVSPNGTVEQNVTVDSTIGSMTFSLNWPGSDLDLTLIRPDGSIVDPTIAESDPDLTFTSGSTYEFYAVYAPQPGIWTMRIFGKSTGASGEDYMVSVSATDAMIVSAEVDTVEYIAGNPIKLTASVEDSSLIDPLAADYVHGLTMHVTVENPELNTSSFELYDDGLHGDESSDDGIYANTFSNTELEGSYNFNIQISGTNNLYGQSFSREYSLSTVVKAPLPPPPDLIFADGFESGNFSAWWWADTNSDLTVSTQAAAVGNYGMQAVVNDTGTLLVYDNSPVDETHYSARFYFHPNSVNIPNGQGLYLFSASDNTSWIMCLYLQHIGESYLLNLCGKDDARAWFETDGVYINDAWTEVELEWQAASAAGANNGYLKLWINDTQADSVQNLDNDTLFVHSDRMGVDGQPANTTGTMYFDAFESRAGSHIGLDPNGPALYTLPAPPDSIFADGFESNDLNAWDWAETNGGNLSTSAEAAAVGNYGMQAVITGGGTMAMTEASVVNVLDESDPFFFNPESESSPNGLEYLLNSFMPEMVVYDNTPRAEKHYDVRFYFDPNSVDLPNGQGMYSCPEKFFPKS